jgi:hypothetical protein
MKTITLLLFIIIPFIGFPQDSDLIYVPDQNTLVATYNNNYNSIGLYIGGYVTTSLPNPYIYTTPVSRLNRIGISLTNHKISLMGGVFMENYVDKVKFKPDVWVKVYPLRILTNTEKGFDFVLAINYMDSVRYGVGVLIPFN